MDIFTAFPQSLFDLFYLAIFIVIISSGQELEWTVAIALFLAKILIVWPSFFRPQKQRMLFALCSPFPTVYHEQNLYRAGETR